MLSEIYPGGSPKTGSSHWDQIHEMGIISVVKRILKRLHDLLEQVIFGDLFLLHNNVLLTLGV